jgi:ABC-type glycerol-3-phosphate transport system substrate-binding protein
VNIRRTSRGASRAAAVLVAASLVAVACGGDDDDAADTPEGTTAAEATEPAAGTATTAAGATTPAGDGETIRLWLNGGDTPDELVDFAIAQFNAIHPDVTVQFERQEWTGLVEKLTTSLSSSDSPDVVEFGNTQAQTFEAAGAVVDLTEHQADLGGDDLLQSLLEAGTYDGKFYAVPYYAGARVIIYRKDLFEAAGVEIPTTLDEFLAAGVALKEANADVPNFSGIYLPGRNWHGVLPFIWEFGGDIATQEGDQWVGQLDSPGSIAGLEFFKQVFDTANAAPADSDDANDYIAFCNGEVGMMPAPGWKPGQIVNPDDGCPDMEANIGVFALPGSEPGTTSPVFLGGSNLAIPTNSDNQELGLDLLKVLISPEYQAKLAETGLLPALKSQLGNVPDTEAAQAQATAAENSRFVPSSENWGAVEAANVLQDMLVEIAQGGDVLSAAATADAAIEETLNG